MFVCVWQLDFALLQALLSPLSMAQVPPSFPTQSLPLFLGSHILPSSQHCLPGRTQHRYVQRDSERARGRGCGLGYGKSLLGGSHGSGSPGNPGGRGHT